MKIWKNAQQVRILHFMHFLPTTKLVNIVNFNAKLVRAGLIVEYSFYCLFNSEPSTAQSLITLI